MQPGLDGVKELWFVIHKVSPVSAQRHSPFLSAAEIKDKHGISEADSPLSEMMTRYTTNFLREVVGINASRANKIRITIC